MRSRSLAAMVAVVAIALAACSPEGSGLQAPSSEPTGLETSPSSAGPSESPSPEPTLPLTKVSVRIGPTANAEFAGYIAAEVLGYYADEGLAVDLVTSDPTTRSYVGSAGPEFTVADVADVLAAREHGSDLVEIGQIFQRSGMLLVTWKPGVPGTPCDLAGKSIGLWPSPGDLEIVARLAQCPLGAADYTRVDQGRDVAGFLAGSVDAVEARVFDEYARILEAIDPATGKQYTAGDLATFSVDTDRTATLKDAIFARAGWLADAGNRDIAVSFVRAAIRGWVYCRDHQDDCVQFVTRGDAALGTSHQRWMLNEVNGLIWPSPSGIGTVDQAAWDQTVTLALANGVLTARPPDAARDDTIVPDAVDLLSDLDLSAPDFNKGAAAVAPSGK